VRRNLGGDVEEGPRDRTRPLREGETGSAMEQAIDVCKGGNWVVEVDTGGEQGTAAGCAKGGGRSATFGSVVAICVVAGVRVGNLACSGGVIVRCDVRGLRATCSVEGVCSNGLKGLYVAGAYCKWDNSRR